jgi:hypothetical protein
MGHKTYSSPERSAATPATECGATAMQARLTSTARPESGTYPESGGPYCSASFARGHPYRGQRDDCGSQQLVLPKILVLDLRHSTIRHLSPQRNGTQMATKMATSGARNAGIAALARGPIDD